ncbi:MAG: phosphotransferase [bacterium]|nr:phosphotransferase [bacterium]
MRKIDFKNIKLIRVNKYYFSKSETIEASVVYNNKKVPAIIKVERFSKNDLTKEIDILSRLNEEDLIRVPKIYETGNINGKNYYVCEKIKGDNLNFIIRKNFYYRYNYLFEYGKSLALLHLISCDGMPLAKKRNINIISDSKINGFIPSERKNLGSTSFVHGDYHFGNVLWQGKKISGIIDFEYSGVGIKEEDIAFALAIKPKMIFMDNILDIEAFLNGYKSVSNYDGDALKYYYKRYLLDEYGKINDIKFKNKVLKLLKLVENIDEL